VNPDDVGHGLSYEAESDMLMLAYGAGLKQSRI
jgi:hypothetical protein